MSRHSTTPADSHPEHHHKQLTRRDFLSSIVAAVTSVFIEPNDPPDLPGNIPFGARWHLWWPGSLDEATIDRMIWAWDWSISEVRAREILHAAANREYTIEQLRENADINSAYKQMRPPNRAYVK